MTRFARAKGSKASNERVPEQATSWSEMKQQLLMKNKESEENKKRQQVNEQRNANYKAFLEEREENESKKTSWADFPETDKPIKKVRESVSKRTRKSNGEFSNRDSSDDEEFTELKLKVDQVLSNMNTDTQSKGETVKKGANDSVIIEKKSKRKKQKSQTVQSKAEVTEKSNLKIASISTNNNNVDSDSDAPPEEETAKNEITKPVIKIQKPKPKKLKILVDRKSEDAKESEENKGGTKKSGNKRKLSEGESSMKKKLKKNTENGVTQKNEKGKVTGNQEKKVVKENLTEKELKKIEKKKAKRWKQVQKKKEMKAALKKQKEEAENEESASNIVKENETSNDKDKHVSNSYTNEKNGFSKDKFEKRNNSNKKTKKEKNGDKQEHSRKKPLLPHKMFINGKELEIEYVDGFPVKKEDAARLKKLRKEMISKGLPRSEINVALKLERRKAEKAFAREKKKVR